MCIYIYIYMHMHDMLVWYIQLCICVYVIMYVLIYIYIYKHICVVHVYIYIYIYTYTHTYIHVHVECVCVYIYIYIYTYAYMHGAALNTNTASSSRSFHGAAPNNRHKATNNNTQCTGARAKSSPVKQTWLHDNIINQHNKWQTKRTHTHTHQPYHIIHTKHVNTNNTTQPARSKQLRTRPAWWDGDALRISEWNAKQALVRFQIKSKFAKVLCTCPNKISKTPSKP